MKKTIKIILGIVVLIILLIIIDLICIFNMNKPLFAIKEKYGDVYRGLFYDTYNCLEYSIPQIKSKGTKFTCAINRINLGKVVEIKSKAKVCAAIKEEFYQDENYTYYWECIKSYGMIVRYESGYEENVSDALKYGNITISDLDKYNIDYIKEENNQ